MKTIITSFIAVLFGIEVYAEFGVNVLMSANYKAEFGLQSGIYSVNDPGATTGIADRYYDDGYNRVDSSDNFGDLTTYWGYQDASQYDSAARTITMNSQRLNLNENAPTTDDQHTAQPGLEVWWQKSLISGERNEPYQPRGGRDREPWFWHLDIRAALRWQHIEMDQKGYISGALETVSDVYSTGGALPPAAPFDGTFAGPNMALDAVPSSRTITPLASGSVVGQYELEADLFAFDCGPALIFDLDYGARFSLSAGATLAYARSEFDYSFDNFTSGNDSVNEALFGWYASADFLFGEGAVLGFATYQLQDMEHSQGSSYATLDFSDSYTFRFGLAF